VAGSDDPGPSGTGEATGPGRTDAAATEVLAVERYAAVQAILEDTAGFTAVGAIDCGQRRPLIPLQSSPADHPRHRAALESALGSRVVAQLEPRLRAVADELVDGFEPRGEVDMNAAVSKPFPVWTLMTLLGLPRGDHDTIRGFHDGILGPHLDVVDGCPVASPAEVGDRIYEYFDSVVAGKRRSPGPDLISTLQRASRSSRMSDDEIVDACYLLVLAGIDPVARALACSIAYFAGRPEERAQAVADPRQLRRTIEELLRWGTSVEVLTRLATGRGAVDGELIQSGRRVTCALGSANRDPDAFEHPAEVDPDRRRAHLAFGTGAHQCVGAHLARLQIRLVVEQLHRRLPDHRLAGPSVDVDPSVLTADDPLLVTFRPPRA
jgi:cytochrome P450